MPNSRYSTEAEQALYPETLPFESSHAPSGICPRCGTDVSGPGNFCTACGAGIMPEQSQPQSVESGSSHHAVSRGFGQAFGLHPAAALLTIIINAMLFGGELATADAILPMALAVALILGIITWRVQLRWYADDNESALLKGVIVGLLTAIPTSLPGFLTVPSGIVGVIHTLRGRKEQ